jgi:hypothetical protein
MSLALDPALLFSAAGYRPDPWQMDAVRADGDRVALLAARQTGKSLTAVMKCIHRAVFFDSSLCLMTAPSERQATELLRKWKDNYRRLGEPVSIARELETTVELANSSRVLALPGDASTVRCFSGVNLLLVDEAAMVPGDDLFIATMPMVATSKGQYWMLSTPMGRRGYFHDAWTNGGADWTRITARASDCPRISASFLQEQRRTLGQRWYSQEYECNFVDTMGAVFDRETIEAMFGEHDCPLLEGF